jgi:uncharacterized protein (TIGR02996 family)
MDHGFLAAILADPDDDLPRLVYADWLEEHGDDRAEFIRVQCELAPLSAEGPLAVHSPLDPRRDALEGRQKLLLTRNGKRWSEGLPVRPKGRFYRDEGAWQRGFVAELRLPAGEFLAGADELFRTIPLQSVWLEDVGPLAGELARSPHLQRLRVLDLTSNRLTDAQARRLLAAPQLRLRELDLGSTGEREEAIGILAGSPRFAGLEALDLGHGRITPAGLTALVRSPHLSRLRALELDGNRFGPAGIRALFGDRDGPRLSRMDLRRTNFTDEAARALADSPRAAALTDLNLCCNPLGAGGLRTLADSPQLGNLESLWVGETQLSPEGLAALSASTHLPRLKRLWLDNHQFGGGVNVPVGPAGVRALTSASGFELAALHLKEHGLGDEGVRALADWPALRCLHTLRLPKNRIGDEGARALANSPHLARLYHLDLGDNAIGDAGLVALAESPFLRQLRSLDLGSNAVGARGVQALAASEGVRHLRELDLGSNPVGDAGAVALARSAHLPALQTLWLGGCGVGVAGGQALAHSENLGDVIFLLLFHNPLDEATRQALRDRFGPAVRV